MRAPRRRLRCYRQAENQPLSCDQGELKTLPMANQNCLVELCTQSFQTHILAASDYSLVKERSSDFSDIRRRSLSSSPASIFYPAGRLWLRQGRRDGSDHSNLVNSSPHTKQATILSSVHKPKLRCDPRYGREDNPKGHYRKNPTMHFRDRLNFACRLDSPALLKECCKPHCATQTV